MIMASAPANGLPNPTAVANKTPQTRSGMVRTTLRKAFANRYAVSDGAVMRDAQKARGTARRFPIVAPMIAIWSVSMNGSTMLNVSGCPRLFGHFHTGGQKSSAISPMRVSLGGDR